MPTKFDPRRKRSTPGAGVYSGYSKNYKPSGSSIGSKQETAALKALQFLVGDGGGEQQYTARDGKTYTIRREDAGVSGVAGAIGQMVAKNAAKIAAEGLAKSAKPVGGKTAQSVAKDAAKAASRRTKAESATIRQGTARSRTAEGATTLEKRDAAAAARSSVNTAPRSSVTPRTGTSTGTLSRGITQKRMGEFVADRGGRIAADAAKNIKRTPAQAKRAQADLADSLKRGAEARAQGRKPGEDIPGSTGRGINEPAPAPRTIKPTPKQADREAMSKALTKPKWNGKESSRAKYEKDLAAYNKRIADMKAKTKDIDEGRRKATGELKGASAKSARRQEEKRAKNAVSAAKPKKPSAKKPTTTPAGKDVARVSPNQAERVKKPVDIVATPVKPKAGASTPLSGKPTAKGPFAKGSPRAIEARQSGSTGSRRASASKDLVVRPKGTVASRPSAPAKPVKIRDIKGRAARAATVLAGVGAAGTALKGTGAGTKKTNVGSDSAKASGKASNAKAFEDSGRKQAANTRTREGIRDNKGRLIDRGEFNQRSAFRARFGLDKMTEAQREKWRKENPEAWKAEVKRRENYRSTEGKKRFGKKALRITDKTKTRRDK